MNRIAAAFVFVLVFVFTASAGQKFVAALTGVQEVPTNGSLGRGTCKIDLNLAETQISVTCNYTGLPSGAIAGHIHGPAAVGGNAPPVFNFGTVTGTSGTIGPLVFTVSPAHVLAMRSHLYYVNIHSNTFPNGEIRGQIKQVHTVSDFDGDGRSDITVFRQSTNTFWIRASLNLAAYPIVHGSGANDIYLPMGDFDGDGLADPILLKLNGVVLNWNILQTSNNTIRSINWGDFTTGNNETLAPADYDGDGTLDIAVYRRGTGTFHILRSSDNGYQTAVWGASPDFPSVGDYDGDGKADYAVVRAAAPNRVWHILQSSNGAYVSYIWGSTTGDSLYFFAPFDIDRDGRQDIAVSRIDGSLVRHRLVRRSSDGGFEDIPWGLQSDVESFGDYDGDGKTDLVARRTLGGNFNWFIRRSSDLSFDQIVWGIASDQGLTEDPDHERFMKTTSEE